jgi:hypothetical protein
MRKTCGADGRIVVTFRVPAYLDARDACVCGGFNDWTPGVHRLTCRPDGEWELAVALAPGRHEFRYLLDGERWINDPDADDFVPNAYGGQNSVVEVVGYGEGRPHRRRVGR